MAGFKDLPEEIHKMIAKCCADAGHHVLSKFSLLNRYYQLLARPLLTTSADLTFLKDDERKLQLFTHHFAPPLRTELVKLSITLGRSETFTGYSMEEGLDDIYSNILSLLPLLQTLKFTLSSSIAKDELEKDDFSLTLTAASRLKYLENLTISRNVKDSLAASTDSSRSLEFIGHIIFNFLPRFQCLKKINLHRLVIVVPRHFSQSCNKLEKLTHLNLQSVQLIDTTPILISDDFFYRFINFFSASIESLIIQDFKIDSPLYPRNIMAPRLNHLDASLTASPDSSDKGLTPNQIQNDDQAYRRFLEYFSNSELESIRLQSPTGLTQFGVLKNSGGFKNVFRVIQ